LLASDGGCGSTLLVGDCRQLARHPYDGRFWVSFKRRADSPFCMSSHVLHVIFCEFVFQAFPGRVFEVLNSWKADQSQTVGPGF